MRDYLKFYIDGAWVDPAAGARQLDVINPATEGVAGRISLGGQADVDAAVAAAKRAFGTYSMFTREQRLELLQNIVAEYQKRYTDVAAAVTEEMGAPVWLATQAHAAVGIGHLMTGIEVLKTYSFEELHGTTMIAREPVGVCAFITPWNWPINQIACKVVPALATGCTMVLKPSEIAPFSAQVWTEILHAAGVPAGVFNLVNGDGPTVGAALSSHPDVDMVSFTGSTRAGIEVARNAAPTVKRVAQELGGKSPNIVLDDADLTTAVTAGVLQMMNNSGQSCNAPSRMLVPAAKMAAGQGDRARRRRERHGRLARRQRQDRPGGQRGAVDQDPGPDPEGHRRGRHARRWRHRQARGAGDRLLRQADGVRRRHQRHDHRA